MCDQVVMLTILSVLLVIMRLLAYDTCCESVFLLIRSLL